MTNIPLRIRSRRLEGDHWIKEKMPGSAKAQIIMDDSAAPLAWVVKSINSVQGGLVSGKQAAFNDYIGSRIAEFIGFPVAEAGIMSIDTELLDNFPHLRTPAFGIFVEGEHFCCKYYAGAQTLEDFAHSDTLLVELDAKCINKDYANHIVAFDTGTVNWDRSITDQGLKGENRKNILFIHDYGSLRLTMIDHGYCFAANWDCQMPPVPPSSVGAWPDLIFGMFHELIKVQWYDQTMIIDGVTRLQSITAANLLAIFNEVPQAWLGFTDQASIDKLRHHVLDRFVRLQDIINVNYVNSHRIAMAGRP